MAPWQRPLDNKPSFLSVVILLVVAALLILVAQLNGKPGIGSELPYDLATTLILVAAFDAVIQRWYGVMNREERGLRTFETLAYAEQARLGRELTFEEVRRLFLAARKPDEQGQNRL